MKGFNDALRCKECGKIYWNSDRCCFDEKAPYYCHRCGAQLFIWKEEKTKKCFHNTGTEYWGIEKVRSVNEVNVEKIVAKKILFWWKVRKEGVK